MPGPLDRLRRFFSRSVAFIHPSAHSWESGVPEEVTFWDGYLGATEGPMADERRERLDPEMPLQWYLAALLPPVQGTCRILDVGAGPLTWVGKRHTDFTVELVAVDPLAEAYDNLLAKHGIVPPVRTLACAAEELTARFAPASFDLVNARNCIDHSRDALLAIRQMLAVVKPGCTVLMHHNIREAERQGFSGMHAWNFWPHDGDFWVGWVDAAGKRQSANVNEMLRGEATIETRVYDEYWMHNLIRRTPQ